MIQNKHSSAFGLIGSSHFKFIRKNIAKFFLFLGILLVYQSAYSTSIKGKIRTKYEPLNEAVVYIEKIEGKTFSPPEKPVIMDQIDLTFIPHVLPILVGTTVIFPNSDDTRHSVFSASKTNKFDFGSYAQGLKKKMTFVQPGVVPLLCHVHPEMSAFIVVVETPFFSITDEEGSFQIKNVPPGKYKLTVWHEWAKTKTQQITVLEHQDLSVNFILD
ncbi:MAG: hypothetical protein HW421_1856 [Ignavibacteria bacterium]|nr:hypothetical protein [Ignavibacteria bacterium]